MQAGFLDVRKINEGDINAIDDAVNRFFDIYNEDSSARVSKEAFEKVLDSIGDVFDKIADGMGVCQNRDHRGFLVMITHRTGDMFLELSIELRTKFMFAMHDTRERLWGLFKLSLANPQVPMHEILDQITTKPESKRVDLETLESWGMKPHFLVRLIHDTIHEAHEHGKLSEIVNPFGNSNQIAQA